MGWHGTCCRSTGRAAILPPAKCALAPALNTSPCAGAIASDKRGSDLYRRMIRIAISQAALRCNRRHPSWQHPTSRTSARPNGDVYVWLDHETVAKLRAARRPGEDFSAVILRLAEAHAGGEAHGGNGS